LEQALSDSQSRRRKDASVQFLVLKLTPLQESVIKHDLEVLSVKFQKYSERDQAAA